MIDKQRRVLFKILRLDPGSESMLGWCKNNALQRLQTEYNGAERVGFRSAGNVGDIYYNVKVDGAQAGNVVVRIELSLVEDEDWRIVGYADAPSPMDYLIQSENVVGVADFNTGLVHLLAKQASGTYGSMYAAVNGNKPYDKIDFQLAGYYVVDVFLLEETPRAQTVLLQEYDLYFLVEYRSDDNIQGLIKIYTVENGVAVELFSRAYELATETFISINSVLAFLSGTNEVNGTALLYGLRDGRIIQLLDIDKIATRDAGAGAYMYKFNNTLAWFVTAEFVGLDENDDALYTHTLRIYSIKTNVELLITETIQTAALYSFGISVANAEADGTLSLYLSRSEALLYANFFYWVINTTTGGLVVHRDLTVGDASTASAVAADSLAGYTASDKVTIKITTLGAGVFRKQLLNSSETVLYGSENTNIRMPFSVGVPGIFVFTDQNVTQIMTYTGDVIDTIVLPPPYENFGFYGHLVTYTQDKFILHIQGVAGTDEYNQIRIYRLNSNTLLYNDIANTLQFEAFGAITEKGVVAKHGVKVLFFVDDEIGFTHIRTLSSTDFFGTDEPYVLTIKGDKLALCAKEAFDGTGTEQKLTLYRYRVPPLATEKLPAFEVGDTAVASSLYDTIPAERRLAIKIADKLYVFDSYSKKQIENVKTQTIPFSVFTLQHAKNSISAFAVQNTTRRFWVLARKGKELDITTLNT
jgi:hypothetical protein